MEVIKMTVPRKQYIVRFDSDYSPSYKGNSGAVAGIAFAKRYKTLKQAQNYVDSISWGNAEVVELEMSFDN